MEAESQPQKQSNDSKQSTSEQPQEEKKKRSGGIFAGINEAFQKGAEALNQGVTQPLRSVGDSANRALQSGASSTQQPVDRATEKTAGVGANLRAFGDRQNPKLRERTAQANERFQARHSECPVSRRACAASVTVRTRARNVHQCAQIKLWHVPPVAFKDSEVLCELGAIGRMLMFVMRVCGPIARLSVPRSKALRLAMRSDALAIERMLKQRRSAKVSSIVILTGRSKKSSGKVRNGATLATN